MPTRPRSTSRPTYQSRIGRGRSAWWSGRAAPARAPSGVRYGGRGRCIARPAGRRTPPSSRPSLPSNPSMRSPPRSPPSASALSPRGFAPTGCSAPASASGRTSPVSSARHRPGSSSTNSHPSSIARSRASGRWLSPKRGGAARARRVLHKPCCSAATTTSSIGCSRTGSGIPRPGVSPGGGFGDARPSPSTSPRPTGGTGRYSSRITI